MKEPPTEDPEVFFGGENLLSPESNGATPGKALTQLQHYGHSGRAKEPPGGKAQQLSARNQPGYGVGLLNKSSKGTSNGQADTNFQALEKNLLEIAELKKTVDIKDYEIEILREALCEQQPDRRKMLKIVNEKMHAVCGSGSSSSLQQKYHQLSAEHQREKETTVQYLKEIEALNNQIQEMA